MLPTVHVDRNCFPNRELLCRRDGFRSIHGQIVWSHGIDMDIAKMQYSEIDAEPGAEFEQVVEPHRIPGYVDRMQSSAGRIIRGPGEQEASNIPGDRLTAGRPMSRWSRGDGKASATSQRIR